MKVEGIRRTSNGWAVVLSGPTPAGDSGLPGQRRVILGSEFTGVGAKARAIKAAKTNRVVEGPASKLAAIA